MPAKNRPATPGKKHFLARYRHRAGVDTVCLTVPDTRSATPPACLYRYADAYRTRDGGEVIEGVRWRAHTTHGYLFIRIDAPTPVVPMSAKILSSRVCTILALLGVPVHTWAALRVARLDIAYDTPAAHVPNALTPAQRKRKMKITLYTGEHSTTTYIGNKSRKTAYYPKHTELIDNFDTYLPDGVESYRREERFLSRAATARASLHTMGRVLRHTARVESKHRRRLYNNVPHLPTPCYHSVRTHPAAVRTPAAPAAPTARGRSPPFFPYPHTPHSFIIQHAAHAPCCCPMLTYKWRGM